jgi:hypothetical protein
MTLKAKEMSIDVRRLLFPLIGGKQEADGFHRTGLLGTGFFVSRLGLAMTAAHVLANLRDGVEARAALPSQTKSMTSYGLLWKVILPGSDMAVIRVNISASACFLTRFGPIDLGQDVETSAIPESMLITDPTGKTGIRMRIAKGYVSHGDGDSIAASFALPKGMSGAPLIVTEGDLQFVSGMFVGQSRGEEIEDQITDVSDEGPQGRHTLIERVSRVEYFARGELLARYADFAAEEFGGATLQRLITQECAG